MEAVEFRNAVLEAIRSVPHGRVSTYGHIAKLVGFPKHARHVGHVLKSLNDDEIDWEAQRRIERREQRRERRRQRREARRQARVQQAELGDTGEDIEPKVENQDENEANNAEEAVAEADVPPADQTLTTLTVPWHRILNATGRISARFPASSVDIQALLLQDEGVDVYRDGWNKWTVSLRSYGWFPASLD